MSKRVFSVLGGVALVLSTSAVVLTQAQTTTTTTVVRQATQNADGTWTVVEYPAGKRITVNLTSTGLLPGAVGQAIVFRDGDSTTIKLDASGLAGDVSGLNLYAVEPSGSVTFLGPVTVNNGVATFSTMTKLNRFMLVVSPDADLAAIGPDTRIAFRSAIPDGMSVIPVIQQGAATGETVSTTATTAYDVPMIDVSGYQKHRESELKLRFADEAAAGRANFYITREYDSRGMTRVKAKFHDLYSATGPAFLTLWAETSDGTFQRLGSTSARERAHDAEIDTDKNGTNVPMGNFGIFMTVEQSDSGSRPVGPVVVRVVK